MNNEQLALISIELAIRKSRQSFLWFVKNVFSASFGLNEFVYGKYIEEVITGMEEHKWTMDVSARDHFKSTRLYAEVMYDLFTTQTDLECRYFSYQAGMSGYHLGKIKRMIEQNPFFHPKMFIDQSPTSLSVLRYTTPNGAIYEARPEGLLSFKRGIHAERIYVDDPLKDPENKLAPTVIHKINNVIKLEIFPMVKKGGYYRVVGTPQTNHDFFFDKGLQRRLHTNIRPAIKSEKKKEVIFPEWKSYEELNDIRKTIGEKAFNQEYMTKPAYSENSYIERKDLNKCVDIELEDYENKPYQRPDGVDIVAGFDIGKKAHPSHFAIFERTINPETNQYQYKQIHQKFLDHVEYKDQVEYINLAVEKYEIDILRYDNTRAEFEAFAEQQLLPKCMIPVQFNMRTNNLMAVSLNKIIQEERVKFIDEERQIDQILQVNNDLKAIESPLGHGDSFWSNALALYEEKPKEYSIRFL